MLSSTYRAMFLNNDRTRVKFEILPNHVFAFEHTRHVTVSSKRIRGRLASGNSAPAAMISCQCECPKASELHPREPLRSFLVHLYVVTIGSSETRAVPSKSVVKDCLKRCDRATSHWFG